MNKTIWCFSDFPKSSAVPAGWEVKSDLKEFLSLAGSGPESPVIVYPMPWDPLWCADQERLDEWLAFYGALLTLCGQLDSAPRIVPFDEWMTNDNGLTYKNAWFGSDSLMAFCLLRFEPSAIEVLEELERRAALTCRAAFASSGKATLTPRHYRQLRSITGQSTRSNVLSRHNRELLGQVESLQKALEQRDQEVLTLKSQLASLRLEARLVAQAVKRLGSDMATKLTDKAEAHEKDN